MSKPRHITILISPTGEEFFDAYGPMTKDRNAATLFFTNPQTMREPSRYGNTHPGFWGSERASADRARREFKGWTYRHEHVGYADDTVRTVAECEALNLSPAPDQWAQCEPMNQADREKGIVCIVDRATGHDVAECKAKHAPVLESAPDLLAALKSLHNYTRKVSAGYRNALTPQEDELYTQVEAAIAKATPNTQTA